MAEPNPTKVGRVLVASADEQMLERVTRVLRDVGHSVVSTRRSGRLLYRALEDPFDLVFLDLDVGDLDGLEALQILRRARPGLPVVVVAGFLREREERQLAGEGAFACLRKPIGTEDLDTAVRIAGTITARETEGGGGP